MNIEEGNTEYLSLKSLLHQWKLMHLLQHFIAQNISVEVLKMMKAQHISELLRNFTYGDRIRFEYELEKWRYSIGNPLRNANQVHIMEIPVPVAMPSSAMPNNTTRTVQSKNCETQTYPSPNINHENSCSSQPHHSTSSPQPNLKELKSPQPPPPLPAPRFQDLLSECKETAIYSPRIPARTSAARARDPQTRGRPPASLLAEHMSVQLDAREILERCRPRGPELMKLFETNKRFRPVERVELINLFAHYFYEHSMHLPVKLSYVLEQQILKLFPGERLKDYRTEKRGKIYIRLSNIKNNRRRAREAKAALKQQENSTSRSDEDFQTDSINDADFSTTEEVKMILDEDKEDNSNCSENPLTIDVTDIKQEISADSE